MNTITADDAKAQLRKILRHSIRGHKLYRIVCKEGEAILISEEDYESLIETLELLSTPGLLKSIKRAKKEIWQGVILIGSLTRTGSFIVLMKRKKLFI